MNGSRKKVLIVEDSRTVNNILKKRLEECGYECTPAYSLADAISELESNRFDFITLDLHLPDGEGEEVLETLGSKSTSKIIVLTAVSDKDRRELLFRNGVLDYFDKSSFGDSLIDKMAAVMSGVELNSDKKVLVVDDSVVVTKNIRKLLETRGYTAIITKSGFEAVSIASSEEIDLVILDLELPDMKGTDVLTQIKSSKKNDSLPVLMISATTDPSTIGDCLKMGAADFLRKPYIAEEIVRKVDFWIDYIRKTRVCKRIEVEFLGYKKALDNSTIVSKTDPHGVITYANDQFCEISGYSRSELIGQPHSIVRHPDMPKEFFEELWRTIKAKVIWSGKVKNRRKDGGSYTVFSNVIPILDEHGEIVEYVSVRQDITELEEIKNGSFV